VPQCALTQLHGGSLLPLLEEGPLHRLEVARSNSASSTAIKSFQNFRARIFNKFLVFAVHRPLLELKVPHKYMHLYVRHQKRQIMAHSILITMI
jgi:hypothetical protein